MLSIADLQYGELYRERILRDWQDIKGDRSSRRFDIWQVVKRLNSRLKKRRPFNAKPLRPKHQPQNLQTHRYLNSVLLLLFVPLLPADGGSDLAEGLVDAATSGWLLPLVGVGIFLWASIMWAMVLVGLGIALVLRNQHMLRERLEEGHTKQDL